MKARESFAEYMGRLAAERRALREDYPSERGTDFAIFRVGENTELWLHRSTWKPGGWRVTRRDTRPEWAHVPFTGHTEFDTFEEAIKDLLDDRAVFVSRNVEPVMHDPSEGFRGASMEEIEEWREDLHGQIERDKQRGGHNIVMLRTQLFAVEDELRKRRRGARGNPIEPLLRGQFPAVVAERLERLEERWRHACQHADAAFEAGDPEAEELDAEAEALAEDLDAAIADAEDMEEDDPGETELESELCSALVDWRRGSRSADSLPDLLRMVALDVAPEIGSRATDDQLVAAAEDCYMARREAHLRQRP